MNIRPVKRRGRAGNATLGAPGPHAENAAKISGSPTPYLQPFTHVMRIVGVHGEIPEQLQMTRDQFNALIEIFLQHVAFDEAWYLSRYPDVQEAISAGATPSARDHFVQHGYREGRDPGRVVVDEAYYLHAYLDVAESIATGDVASAQDHFDRHGRNEGRRPFA